MSALAQPRLTGAVSPTCFEADLSARFQAGGAQRRGVDADIVVGRPSEGGAVDEHAVQVAEFLVLAAFEYIHSAGVFALLKAWFGDHDHFIADLPADLGRVTGFVEA